MLEPTLLGVYYLQKIFPNSIMPGKVRVATPFFDRGIFFSKFQKIFNLPPRGLLYSIAMFFDPRNRFKLVLEPLECYFWSFGPHPYFTWQLLHEKYENPIKSEV